MGAPNDFVRMATQDLMGKPKPTTEQLVEQSRQDSPAMASFVDMATRDLQYGADADKAGGDRRPAHGAPAKDIQESAEELRNAFARSATHGDESKEVSEKIIDEFKETAGKEAEDMLSKLLKGIR